MTSFPNTIALYVKVAGIDWLVTESTVIFTAPVMTAISLAGLADHIPVKPPALYLKCSIIVHWLVNQFGICRGNRNLGAQGFCDEAGSQWQAGTVL